ncbi:hypothetical protein T11_13523, partial [Trichinella zimbabwensis]
MDKESKVYVLFPVYYCFNPDDWRRWHHQHFTKVFSSIDGTSHQDKKTEAVGLDGKSFLEKTVSRVCREE